MGFGVDLFSVPVGSSFCSRLDSPGIPNTRLRSIFRPFLHWTQKTPSEIPAQHPSSNILKPERDGRPENPGKSATLKWAPLLCAVPSCRHPTNCPGGAAQLVAWWRFGTSSFLSGGDVRGERTAEAIEEPWPGVDHI